MSRAAVTLPLRAAKSQRIRMHMRETNQWTPSCLTEFGPVCCGRIVDIDADGCPEVDFPGNTGDPVAARALEGVCIERASSRGLQVLLVFEQGDPNRPVVVGIVQAALPAEHVDLAREVAHGEPRTAILDGRHVELRGNDEVTLVCGKSSITLTRDGRITLRGTEIVSRASGTNKIRGASVSIN
jgi:hypothetical protein